jgi:hypothetical protein
MKNKTFYKELHPVIKMCTSCFVYGDLVFILPVTTVILLLYFVSIKFALLMTGSFIAVRYMGEMVYWIAQQFGPKTYRPWDFGFKNIDNNAVYILYQTMATSTAIFGIGIAVAALMFLP